VHGLNSVRPGYVRETSQGEPYLPLFGCYKYAYYFLYFDKSDMDG